jgi:hypothetical protein
MRGIVQFEASIDTYTLTSNAGVVSSIDGVNSVEIMERFVGQSPRFCLVLDVEDEKAEEIEAKLKDLLGQYSDFLSQVSLGLYKKLS